MQHTVQSFVGAVRPLVYATLSLAITGALALPHAAHASAFQLQENSVKGMGRAFAGSTTAGDDASVAINNPAAMSLLEGTTFQVDTTAINFGAKFTGSATDWKGRAVSGGNGGDAGTTLTIPAFSVVTKLNDKFHLGFGMSVPYGFQTEYNPSWVGRYDAVETKLSSPAATLSLSYDLNESFALGVSAIAQRTNGTLSSMVNYNYLGAALGGQAGAAAAAAQYGPMLQAGQITQAQYSAAVQAGKAQGQAMGDATVPPGSDGLAVIKGSSWDYGYQVGALWKITTQDRLALNYRSKISHTLQGTANYYGVPSLISAAASAAVSGQAPFTHTNGTVGFATPASARLSYWHQDERFGLGIDLGWTQWQNAMSKMVVSYSNPNQPPSVYTFDWRNSWFASIGGDYYLNDKFTLRAGIAIDTTPTHADTRDPRVPDSTRQLASVGLGYQASKNFTLDFGYTHVFVNQAHINHPDQFGGTLTGNYDNYSNLFGISARYKF